MALFVFDYHLLGYVLVLQACFTWCYTVCVPHPCQEKLTSLPLSRTFFFLIP